MLYGGEHETHEFAIPLSVGQPSSKKNVKWQKKGNLQIVQWSVKPETTVLSFGEHLDVYLLWRNEAYKYWVLDLPAPQPLGSYTSPSRLKSDSDASVVIVKAGYLIRTAEVKGSHLSLTGDVNSTTDIDLISAPKGCCSSMSFNGASLRAAKCKETGRLRATVAYKTPHIALPNLSKLHWHYTDSLPEIQHSYNDAAWTKCNLKKSNNPRNLTTPTSLYAGDYGYHAGSLIYRGHFVANGKEETIYLHTQGGSAFGHSVWLNSVLLGSFVGNASLADYNSTLKIPNKLEKGKSMVITVVIDHMGLDENFYADISPMKNPRGILDYSVSGHANSSISWKMTGNLGGEHYIDHSRGPLNEGAMFAERQGYHLPGVPISRWQTRSPLQGIEKAGIGFFATTFNLDIPHGYDVPLNVRLNVDSTPSNATNFRVQIFVNGFQFGKYGMSLYDPLTVQWLFHPRLIRC